MLSGGLYGRARQPSTHGLRGQVTIAPDRVRLFPPDRAFLFQQDRPRLQARTDGFEPRTGDDQRRAAERFPHTNGEVRMQPLGVNV
jgi:hypothetical protein